METQKTPLFQGIGEAALAEMFTCGSADTDFEREPNEDAFESDFSDDSADDSDF